MRGFGMAVGAMVITACGRIGFGVEGVDADVARRELALDTRTLPELTGVPVLVALDPSRVDYVRAGDQANRLWFTDPDGSVIPHEVERWDPSGPSTVWVRVPVMSPPEDSIWMWYGATPPEELDAAEVWTSEVGVWHLDRLAGEGSPDAAGANNLQAIAGSEPTLVDGRLAGGSSFDGVDDFLFAPDDPMLQMDQGTSMTLSAWLRARTDALGNVLRYDDNDTADGDSNTARNVYAMRVEPGDDISFFCGPAQATAGFREPLLTVGAWQWITVVRDANARTLSLYVDGAQVRTIADTTSGTWTTSGEYLLVGRYAPTVGPEFLDGTLDELRIARTAQSADWIRAQYLSMTDALIAFGPER